VKEGEGVHLPILTGKLAWVFLLGSFCSWVYVEWWPSHQTPWGCAFSELRLAETHVHCGEGAPLLPHQLWLLGQKADLNLVSLNELKNLPKVPSKVLVGLLEERERIGGFCEWEEVAKFSGIGPARLKSLKEHLFIQCDTKK